jgi:hypothetical protein
LCAVNTSSVWHTGLSGGAPDSVWCARLAGDEMAAFGKTQRCMAIIHWTVRWCIRLSGEPTVASANGRPRDLRATRGPQQRSVGHTGLSCVHQTVSGAPTDLEDQRSDAPKRKEIAHRTTTVTVRSGAPPDRRQIWPSSWPPTAPSCLGAIKETPRRMKEKTKPSRNILRLPDSDSTLLILCVSDLSFI